MKNLALDVPEVSPFLLSSVIPCTVLSNSSTSPYDGHHELIKQNKTKTDFIVFQKA